MLSCHCLNIIIETETSDFVKVTNESLNLSDEETRDSFFKQDIQQVKNLLVINKSCAGLVNVRNVGSWQIYYCDNCGLHTHAIHQTRGATCVLVSCKLFTLADINKLKSSELRSEIFNIIVKSIPSDDEHLHDYVPVEVQRPISSLRQQMDEVLIRYHSETEERVREYTEQQYAELEEFKEKAYREQRALTRILLSSRVSKSNSTTMVKNTPISEPIRTTELPDERKSTPRAVSKSKSIVSPRVNHVRSSNIRMPSVNGASYDAEGLFPLEDMDDIGSSCNSANEDSDNEDSFREDGIEIPPRPRLGSQSMLAKSLPVNIPVFMAPFHGHENDDQDDIEPHPEDPMDIAASIRALANSVHGDTVFGDLPRPRFSTHI